MDLVSNRYKLVEHKDVFAPMQRAIEALKLPVNRVETHLANGGGFAQVTWTLDLKERVRKGDLVAVRLSAQNSIDRTAPLEGSLAGLRLVCTNGMVAPDGSGFRHRWKHWSGLSLDSVEEDLCQLVDNTPQLLERWREWSDVKTSMEYLEHWLEEASVSTRQVIGQHARDLIRDRFEIAPDQSVWDGYNAFTWYGTHHVETRKPDLKILRQNAVLEIANKFAEDAVNNGALN